MATVSESADVKVGGDDMQVFTFRPDGNGPDGGGKSPAVIVIQEIFGVNDHIKDVAGRFAAEGYVAVAPDLFHRSGRGVVPSTRCSRAVSTAASSRTTTSSRT